MLQRVPDSRKPEPRGVAAAEYHVCVPVLSTLSHRPATTTAHPTIAIYIPLWSQEMSQSRSKGAYDVSSMT